MNKKHHMLQFFVRSLINNFTAFTTFYLNLNYNILMWLYVSPVLQSTQILSAWLCTHTEHVCHYFSVLVHCNFKRSLTQSSFPRLWLQREGVPCRRRLTSFWKQYISHIAILLGCQSAGVLNSTMAPVHTPNHVSCYIPLKIEDGLMYVFDKKGQCLCEWIWHLSEWVMAMLFYVFC